MPHNAVKEQAIGFLAESRRNIIMEVAETRDSPENVVNLAMTDGSMGAGLVELAPFCAKSPDLVTAGRHPKGL